MRIERRVAREAGEHALELEPFARVRERRHERTSVDDALALERLASGKMLVGSSGIEQVDHRVERRRRIVVDDHRAPGASRRLRAARAGDAAPDSPRAARARERGVRAADDEQLGAKLVRDRVLERADQAGERRVGRLAVLQARDEAEAQRPRHGWRLRQSR
jgi:hypothetical protein